MNCPRCGRAIPADAVYCIYCAEPLRPGSIPDPQVPATGATIRLNPAAPAGGRVPDAPLRPQMHGPSRRRGPGHSRRTDPSSMLFLAGLGLLIVTHSFWPGILILIGLSHYVKHSRRGWGGAALRDVVFWGGLALLFATHMFWPGILLLLLATSLLGQRRYVWRP